MSLPAGPWASHAKGRVATLTLHRARAFMCAQSSSDQIIQPALSSWFGFFRDNSTRELVPLARTPLYTEDRIGLRALDRAGRLHFARCACGHREVPSSKCKVQAFDLATRDFLQPERSTTALLRWLRLHTRPPQPGRRATPVSEPDEVSQLRAELQAQTARADAAERELQKLRKSASRVRPTAAASAAWRAATAV